MIRNEPSNNHYDYIFTGAGCASLSLLMRLLQQPATKGKRILLLDKTNASMLNKTWCFWEKEKGFFESIVHQQYNQLWYHSDGYSKLSSIHPYKYKMIRGEDFHRYCMEIIDQFSNVEIVLSEIEKIDEVNASITIGEKAYKADYIFNSIVFKPPVLKKNEHMLLQHFKGWFIETETAVFDPAAATLMDFRVSQEHGTSFVYVMPFNEKRALVEYTLFTGELLPSSAYDEALKQYLSEYIKAGYSVTAEETGVIPMTNYRWPESNGRVINIGTAGGQTKASSGYTFQFIQYQSDQLANQLANNTRPVPHSAQHTRFHFYDAVLLEVLAEQYLPGEKIFTKLFSRNKLPQVLQFLANQSTLSQELRLISVLPKWPFLKAALHQVFR